MTTFLCIEAFHWAVIVLWVRRGWPFTEIEWVAFTGVVTMTQAACGDCPLSLLARHFGFDPGVSVWSFLSRWPWALLRVPHFIFGALCLWSVL